MSWYERNEAVILLSMREKWHIPGRRFCVWEAWKRRHAAAAGVRPLVDERSEPGLAVRGYREGSGDTVYEGPDAALMSDSNLSEMPS